MNAQQAIAFIHANLAAIGNAARMQNPAALDVQTAYAQYCQYQHDVTEELLVNAVVNWQRYVADNPRAEV